MTQTRKRSRMTLTFGAVVLIAGALAVAFWPQPALVDLGQVVRAPMQVTIDEEGRTRVSEPYVVSTPVAGRLQRVEVNPGDPVVRGETVVAHMLPTNPSALDVRTREQARAAVTAAEAALRVSRADLNAALAKRDLAWTELSRTQTLVDRRITSEVMLERAQQSARVAQAAVDTAEAAIAMREAELANARALLIGFEDSALAGAVGVTNGMDIPLHAPADGRILRVIQQSATTLPAGAPIMEIGNVDSELEVVVDLISSDAVQVSVGDPVALVDWGGPQTLEGEVERIDPFGVTKYSALGVEEQRVATVVRLTSPASERAALGHGFRVEARIVVWQDDQALTVPASALFRVGPDWAVFVLRDGTARQTPVQIGHSNGTMAQVLSGLDAGDTVILYPSAAITHGTKVAPRQVP
ncbi:HlyD family efflux transporter periplasmic adaptor subunit [Rhodobacteraceae bacterium M382]|nr:HlyD family efflux transporter periplasmic adaptor subunit [Rhodobacteraceae bacterium M382]